MSEIPYPPNWLQWLTVIIMGSWFLWHVYDKSIRLFFELRFQWKEWRRNAANRR